MRKHLPGIRNPRIQKFSTIHRFLVSLTRANQWLMTQHSPEAGSYPPGIRITGIQNVSNFHRYFDMGYSLVDDKTSARKPELFRPEAGI